MPKQSSQNGNFILTPEQVFVNGFCETCQFFFTSLFFIVRIILIAKTLENGKKMIITIHNKRLKFAYIKATMFVFFCALLLFWGIIPFETEGENYFRVYLNGMEVGVLGDAQEAEQLLIQARRKVASDSSELTFIETDLEIRGEEVLWGRVDDSTHVLAKMLEVLDEQLMETLQRSYSVKVNETIVNLRSAEEVKQVLQTAINQYDTQGEYVVDLVMDTKRSFGAMTVQVLENSEMTEAAPAYSDLQAGIQCYLTDMGLETPKEEKGPEDYELGISSMYFAEEIEVVEAYLQESQLMSVETACQKLIALQEVPTEYTVVAGDTLSEIAMKVDIPLDNIIAMNPTKLTSMDSTIHIGDKLVIMVPEPELSVIRTEETYVEEIYDADVIYIDNDNWFTTESKVLQQPSAGFRKAVVSTTYENDVEIQREILYEEVVKEAVPKIVERGTKIPPSFIRPISGGRTSSPFGKRTAPKKGASTYHKGIDWAIPTGTSVKASCGGTVTKAGWGSGYGYVVYIRHENGMETRYAHLSKVLVKAGDSVRQGQVIAKSGNTGISTGPHLHFEILKNGTAVNPKNYGIK